MSRFFVVRASGGLSNRLQAILGGIAYCLLTNRTLCVDWRDGLYSDDFSNIFYEWFDICHVKTALCEQVFDALAQGAEVYPIFWKEHLQQPIAVEYLFPQDNHLSTKIQTLSNFDLKQEHLLENDAIAAPILVYWGWDCTGINTLIPLLQEKYPYFKNLDNLDIQRELLQNYLIPTQNVCQAVESFYNTHFHKPPLGIHIRHSDLQSPLPKMLNFLEKIHQKNDELFLCTDNEFVEKMVKRLYPHCQIRSKTFQGVNVPLHCFVPGISNVQKGFDAVVEMLILAKCRSIIYYAPSSFSKISILFSQLTRDQIYAVPT